MTDDKRDSLKQRVTERRNAAARKLRENLGGGVSFNPPQKPSTQAVGVDQLSQQMTGAMYAAQTETDPIGTLARYGEDQQDATGRPAAPTGQWRCIVNSDIVSIDLIANISADGTLSAQGTLVYVVTNKIYEVSGQGDWTALPPDTEAPNWLFKFRVQPSTHAIFSWFAAPTQSPNHLHNRFVLPNNRGVVETHCERIG